MIVNKIRVPNCNFKPACFTLDAHLSLTVSENKVLTHPSSVDSIPTSANQENHVSMGGFAARKALSVVEHVEQIVSIELLAACQALDLRKDADAKKKTTPPLEKVYKLVREAGVRFVISIMAVWLFLVQSITSPTASGTFQLHANSILSVHLPLLAALSNCMQILFSQFIFHC